MGHPYIPRPDADFDTWANAFTEAAFQWWIDHGLDFQEISALGAARDRWVAAWPAHVSARAAAEAARAEKDAARGDFEPVIREFARIIQADPATTDADRATLGLTVRSEGSVKGGALNTRPLARIDAGQRLMHTVRFADESTPTRKAKPKGAVGAEVWVTVVGASEPVPTDPKSLRFHSLSTDGSALAEFKGGDGGKKAVYMLRWVGVGGERGPWSDPHVATVAA